MTAQLSKIDPVRREIIVRVVPSTAFRLFTGSMGAWWPKGQTVGATAHEDIVIEPRNGGRWFERAETGVETNWGRVLEWQPPVRVLLAWQLNSAWVYDPDFLTEVEVRFEPRPNGETRVLLEHRLLERFGATAEKSAASFDKGWAGHLKTFADYAEQARAGEPARTAS
jgi:uncharacterized protein YndB with AHSA1/START domain